MRGWLGSTHFQARRFKTKRFLFDRNSDRVWIEGKKCQEGRKIFGGVYLDTKVNKRIAPSPRGGSQRCTYAIIRDVYKNLLRESGFTVLAYVD